MKIVRTEVLISRGAFSESERWRKLLASIHAAVKAVDWPPGSGKFTIYPQSGKKTGEGNGVKPIKNGLMERLLKEGWELEGPARNARGHSIGDFDAVFQVADGPVVLEWETGNISSSHRSLNKMMMLLACGMVVAGVLVIPSRDMYQYLTDRIGNIAELEPYLDHWRNNFRCDQGYLEIIVIEHDGTSLDVMRIPKGTDGRAAR